MIKPYYRNEHVVKVVEVEDFGQIDLTKLPIRLEREGRYEIGWVNTIKKNGEKDEVLSEYGGKSMFDFGGRELGVLREIE